MAAIRYFTSDLERRAAFYTKHLGIKVEPQIRRKLGVETGRAAAGRCRFFGAPNDYRV